MLPSKATRTRVTQLADQAVRVIRYVRHRGLVFTARRLAAALRPPRVASFELAKARLSGKHGIEIGGPSDLFRDGGLLPLYSVVASLDGCNFAEQTMWEGRVQAGQTYRFSANRAPGKQLIGEASDLTGVPDGHYDFVLSSHCLEHVANPLKALREWTRVCKPGGMILVVVPDPRHTFDRRRPTTSFAHLLDDYQADTGEADLTHLDEILTLHDRALDDEPADPAAFAARARANLQHRGMHHHVFDQALIEQALQWTPLRVLNREICLPSHIVTVSEKPAATRV